MAEQTYLVSGMTCGHCVSAVTREVSAIAGVQQVNVDLETGKVLVTSEATIDQHLIAEAIEEAGYELAG
jgi:copper chaperone